MSVKSVLRAPACPVTTLVHGFSTRLGGHSQGPYESLNLGGAWGDAQDKLQANYATLAQLGGYDPAELVMVKQVHGNAVVRASQCDASTQADGIYAFRDDPGPKLLGVRTADCVPVLLTSLRGDRFAALHSGWRGTVADIVGEGVRALCQETSRELAPSELFAMVGPCIERNAFEVGQEVADQFPAQHRLRYGSGRWHVDLVSMVFEQLRAAGVLATNCVRVGACTHDHPDRFFSYRRDGRPTGQMLSFIGVGRSAAG